MWPCEDADLLRCTIINQSRKTNHIMPCKTVQSLRFQCIATMILIFFVQISHAHASNISTSKVSRDMHHYHGSRYTINELLNTRFTSKISDDIDMDPCKASMYASNAAMFRKCPLSEYNARSHNGHILNNDALLLSASTLFL